MAEGRGPRRVFVALALLVACGGGGGGGSGGSATTTFTDGSGNSGFVPEFGETRVATLKVDGAPADKSLKLFYSPADPDLILGVYALGPEEGRYVAGKLSTGELQRYCGGPQTPRPLRVDVNSAPFKLDGDNLTIFVFDGTAGIRRLVCSHDAVVSNDPAAAMELRFEKMTVVAPDGFWGAVIPSGAVAATQLAHVRYDGTADLTAAPMADGLPLTVRNQRAFYFAAADKVVKFDTAAGTSTEVATGLMPGNVDVRDEGLFVNAGGKMQVVVFSKGTTPVTLKPPIETNVPVVGEPFFDKTGGVYTNWRYDLATGEPSTVSLDGEPITAMSTNVNYLQFLPSGHAYYVDGPITDPMIGGPLEPRDVGFSARGFTSNMAAFERDKWDVDVHAADKAADLGLAVGVKAYKNGVCLVETHNGMPSSVTDAPGMKGTAALFEIGRTVTVTTCGSTTGKTVLRGIDGTADVDSDTGAVIDAPLILSQHIHFLDEPCFECQPTYLEGLYSGWTVAADGTVKPLFKLANQMIFRPHSFENFVVRHGEELVVVAGSAP